MHYNTSKYISISFLPYSRRERSVSFKLRHESIIFNVHKYKNIESYDYKYSFEYRTKFRNTFQDWTKNPKKMNRLFYKKQTRELIKEHFEYVN